MATRKIVLIGGGHAHMLILAQLSALRDHGCEVTVIQPSLHHYYSGMGPGMLGGFYTPEEIRFNTRQTVEKAGGTFIQDKAIRIDPDQQQVFLEQHPTPLTYDVLSCNAGSQVASDRIVPDNQTVFSVKPIEQLQLAQQQILARGKDRPLNIVVVGGGPSAVEVAGNIWRLGATTAIQPPKISVIAGKTLLREVPDKVRDLAQTSLQQRGIELVYGSYAEQVEKGQLILENGTVVAADMIFSAVGIRPSPLFAASGLPVGPDGGLLVNRYLQSAGYDNIFGGGDCIHFQPQPLDKVGVYAVRQNKVLYANLLASATNAPLTQFDPGGKYLLIYNLGDGTGIFCKWSIIFGGRLAFALKDRIDRRFMRTFQ